MTDDLNFRERLFAIVEGTFSEDAHGIIEWVLLVIGAELTSLCDWRNPAFETPGTHEDYHYGSPCPYEDVVLSLLAGLPDPRREV